MNITTWHTLEFMLSKKELVLQVLNGLKMKVKVDTPVIERRTKGDTHPRGFLSYKLFMAQAAEKE